MKKYIYHSAMDKVKASEEFKDKLLDLGKTQNHKKKTFQFRSLVPVFLTIMLLISTGGVYFVSRLKEPPVIKDLDIVEDREFEIMENIEGVEASYISVVYLDGYAYEPISWLSYSFPPRLDDDKMTKGEKIGEVTLDLKGITYRGTPPDFSSTYDVGTEVYEIENVKKEYAVIVKRASDGDYMGNASIFYRTRKVVETIDEPLDLVVSEVFDMVSDSPSIMTVELRSEEDGSWMRTSSDEEILFLLNHELPGSELLNYGEVDIGRLEQRVLVNLLFEDGSMIHIQIYPEEGYAYIFGGFINISEELGVLARSFYEEGEEYQRLTSYLSYDQNGDPKDGAYLEIKDMMNHVDLVCEEPSDAMRSLYHMLSYYRGRKHNQKDEGDLVLIVTMGETLENSDKLEFYEGDNNEILIQVNGKPYEIVMGTLKLKDIMWFLAGYLAPPN